MNTFSKYDPNMVGALFHVRTEEAMVEGKALGLPNFTEGDLKVMLLLVDPQIDFIHENRPLTVKGAVADTRRTIDWIYKNLSSLNYIAASLDTHLPFQIFFPSWFCYEDGSPVDPFVTQVTEDNLGVSVFPIFEFDYEYAKGKTMPWSQYYVTQLALTNGDFTKKDLTVWPYHTMLGTLGHAIDPSLMEAIYFHAAARSSQPFFLIKGNVPWTENYSVLEPEVKFPKHQNGGLNKEALNKMQDHDLIYIAGQAKSHCVYETIVSIVKFFGTKAPDVLKRIRILEDCMSPVGGYEDMATQAFTQLKNQYGLKLVKSNAPIG
jgi:nicotinamidase/pyrazinamidase